jgi:hypothetical protein
MKFLKKYILFLTLFLSCSEKKTDKLNHHDFIKLQNDASVLISNPVETKKSLLYNVHYDFGGMGTGSNYLYFNKNSEYYYTLNSISLNPKKCEIWNGQIIENEIGWSQDRATDTLRWLIIKNWKDEKGQQAFSTDFCANKPLYLKVDSNKLNDGSVYYVDSLQVNYVGKETDFSDITTMKPGLYLLTKPSIFYKRKVNIDDLDTLLK